MAWNAFCRPREQLRFEYLKSTITKCPCNKICIYRAKVWIYQLDFFINFVVRNRKGGFNMLDLRSKYRYQALLVEPLYFETKIYYFFILVPI